MAKRMNQGSPKSKTKLTEVPVHRPENDAGELPEHDTILATAAECKTLQAKGAVIRGELGAVIKGAEADFNIDRSAFKMFLKLDGMEPQRRAVVLRQFDHMRAGSDWDDQRDLFDSEHDAAAPAH